MKLIILIILKAKLIFLHVIHFFKTDLRCLVMVRPKNKQTPFNKVRVPCLELSAPGSDEFDGF